jgi:hypothetical protein
MLLLQWDDGYSFSCHIDVFSIADTGIMMAEGHYMWVVLWQDRC